MVDSAPYLPLISSLLHLYLRSTASYIQDAFRNAEALQNESVKITLDFFFFTFYLLAIVSSMWDLCSLTRD